MYHYIYLPVDCKPYESTEEPSEKDRSLVFGGFLQIIRYDANHDHWILTEDLEMTWEKIEEDSSHES